MDPIEKDRREFFRVPFRNPLKYKAYSEKQATATTENISQSGILFQTEEAPKLSSVLWLSLDIRTLKICQEIEARALIFNNGVLGRVVRVEEDSNSGKGYDVGVCFLKKDQRNTVEVEQLLKTI